MVSQWVSSVTHHVTSPSWFDEIKMNLPTPLNAKHHLLFTFLHISCDLAKQKPQRSGDKADSPSGPETVVGYCWLPLIHKGRLRVEPQTLPVAAHLPPGYLSFEPLGLGRGVSWKVTNCVKSFKILFMNYNSMLGQRFAG